jgi:hypothetical protein
VITPATRPTSAKTSMWAISSRVLCGRDVAVARTSKPYGSIKLDPCAVSHSEHGPSRLGSAVKPLIVGQK